MKRNSLSWRGLHLILFQISTLGCDDLQPRRAHTKAIQTASSAIIMGILPSNFENHFVVCKGVVSVWSDEMQIQPA